MEYPMKVYPMVFKNGKKEWAVEYPDLPGCVGGGETIEEAIKDAQASMKVYLNFLKNEGKKLPIPSNEMTLPSGKIALRVPKTTHKQLLVNAKAEGVSLNTYINTAISEKIGRVSVSKKFKQFFQETVLTVLNYEPYKYSSKIHQQDGILTTSCYDFNKDKSVKFKA